MEDVAKAPGDSSAGCAEPALGLRVREVLGAATLAGARVLAGASGLDRIVRRLNVMEVPDILPWVKPHELLLTTGYPLRDAPDALVDLVAELDERGLAAMAIKLHRYIDDLPPQMLAEADRRAFPIPEFPDGVGFDDVRIVAFSRVPLTDADGHSLERAATVAALAITKQLAVAAVEDKYRADFLRDVVTGRTDDVAAAVAYARTFGWELDRLVVAV